MTPTSDDRMLSNRPTTTERLRKSFKDREYADAYARSALNAYIATQIKVLREQREWTQGQLADKAEMKQPRIAVMEDVNYSSWSISTLWRLAQAFHLRLTVSFEEFGTLPHEIDTFDRKSLERLPLEKDPSIVGNMQNQITITHYPSLGYNVIWANPNPNNTQEGWTQLMTGQYAELNPPHITYNIALPQEADQPPRFNAAIDIAIPQELPTI